MLNSIYAFDEYGPSPSPQGSLKMPAEWFLPFWPMLLPFPIPAVEVSIANTPKNTNTPIAAPRTSLEEMFLSSILSSPVKK